MKSSSRTQLFITLLLLFLITSPCRLAASSLESKLQTLSTALTGLKGKLGTLKSKLGELQGNLAGVLIPPTFDDDEASTVVTMSWTQIDPKVGGALKIQNHNDFLNHIVNPNQENSTTDIILDMDKLQDKQFKKNTYFSENDKFKALQKLLQSKKYYPHLKKIWIYKKKDFGFFGYMADSFGNTKGYNYQHTDWEIDYPFASPPTIPASPIPPSSSAPATPAPQSNQVLITLVRGDITKQEFAHKNTAAIVNAANEQLAAGGGVCGSIFAAVNHAALQAECYDNAKNPIVRSDERCLTGQARITGAHEDPARAVGFSYIIHTAGPKGSNPNKEKLLKEAYQNSLRRADENGITAIAFPAISTALFGYDINDATPVAIKAILDYTQTNATKIQEIRLVTFSQNDYSLYKSFLDAHPDKITATVTSLPAYLQTNNSSTEPPLAFQLTPPASAPAPSTSSSSSSSSWQSPLINKKVRLVLVAGDITQQHFQDSEKAAIVNGASSTFIFGGGVSAKISEALDSKARDIGNYLKELTWHQSGSLKSNIFITNGITSSNKNYGQMAIAFPPEQVKNFIENGRHRWNYNAGDPKSGGCIGSALIHEAYTEEKQPLPFKYLVQAIGPNMTEVSGLTITKLITPTSYHQNQLKFAYQNGLLCADQFQLKSIAFPVVSGGVFRYPTKEAIEVAVKSCVDYLEENAATTNIKEIRFVVWPREKDKQDSSGNTIDGAIFRLNEFDHQIQNSTINKKEITPLDQQYYETNNLTQAPDGTLRGFIKVYEFDLGANQLPSSSSSAAPSASIDTTLLEQLASDLKYYKTSNQDHSGHLYEHSIWTAMVIDRWFEEKNGTAPDSGQSASNWLEGINESDRNTLVLAGFLHDVGKASNVNSNYNFVNASASLNTSALNCAQYPTYHVIGSHPQDGFNFLRLIAPYNLSVIKNAAGLYNAHFKANGQLDFAQMFQELGLTEEQQQIIQILTGIHWSFGADLMIHNNPQNFLLTLKKYVGETDYNNKKIDDRILRLAIAIGAADVCGMQSEPDAYFNEFKQRSPYFQSPVFEQPKQYHATKSPKQQFNDWGYRARGITQRNSLLAFFTKNPQLALIAPVEVPHFFQTPFLYASTLFTQYHETLNPGCC
ncbi:macro domain-containing protein [Candidatus Dependentiae bacterium]|nr:macro domain-containing protein [Candidatus Dependentiae bacterium]